MITEEIKVEKKKIQKQMKTKAQWSKPMGWSK